MQGVHSLLQKQIKQILFLESSDACMWSSEFQEAIQ